MREIQEFFNFDNIGGKIKNLAKWSCWITILLIWVAAPIAFIVLVADDWTAEFCWIPLVGAIIAPIFVWIGSWAMYAFGEFVEDIHAIRDKEGTTKEVNAKREEALRLKRESEEMARREAELKAKQEAKERLPQNEKKLDGDEILYDQHICSSEDELKQYIEKVLDEKSRPKELLDLYWQYKKYIYGYYPENETKLALEKVIKKCQSNAYEGNSQLMITICETKLSKL